MVTDYLLSACRPKEFAPFSYVPADRTMFELSTKGRNTYHDYVCGGNVFDIDLTKHRHLVKRKSTIICY